jgi:hypothetical protein
MPVGDCGTLVAFATRFSEEFAPYAKLAGDDAKMADWRRKV